MTTALKMSSPATDQTFSLIMPLAAEEALLEAVGGKGASLARLARAGLPVPDGFHITTVAYAQLVAANDLQPAVLAALSEVDATLPATLETASQTIGALFAAATIPPQLGDAIALVDRRLYPVRRQALPCALRLPPRICPSSLRRSARVVSQRQRRGGAAGRRQSLLVVALDGSLIGYRVTHGIDPDASQPGCYRPVDGAGRGRRYSLHRQSHQRTARSGHDHSGLGLGRSDSRRHCHAGHAGGRQGCQRDR